MGSKIAYYGLILPISYLPYFLLYALSDFVFVVMYYIVGYRKKVILKNIKNSFPEKTEIEHKRIMRKFYHHFCDLILESLKGFTIPEKQLRKRFKLRNPEVADQFYEQGKDVVFTGGHYNNWEILASGINCELKHLPIGIYKPLHNKFFNSKMKSSRERFGLVLCSMRETKETFEKKFDEPNGIIFGIDQSPSNNKKCHWMTFLNQETAVFFGAEKYAKEYNRPVIFCSIHKVKRGYYEGELHLVSDNPAATANGELTELNTKILEKDIIANPEFWLWSHKRWKLKREN